MIKERRDTTMGTCNISVGKRYFSFSGKVRYYIRINNVTDYYYSEYVFWKNFFEVCEKYEVSRLDQMKLGNSIK